MICNFVITDPAFFYILGAQDNGGVGKFPFTSAILCRIANEILCLSDDLNLFGLSTTSVQYQNRCMEFFMNGPPQNTRPLLIKKSTDGLKSQ